MLTEVRLRKSLRARLPSIRPASLSGLIAVGAVLGISACSDSPIDLIAPSPEAGRLDARPQDAPSGAAPVGFRTFSGGHALLFVPESYRQARPAPLVLAL